MKEKIILAPGANGNELTKNLAGHGVNLINTKVVSAAELARLALMRAGVPITESFLSSREEAAVIAKAAIDETYFGKTTYSDIQQISSVVKRMRTLVASDDEEAVIKEKLGQGIFTEKNAALFSVYKKYIEIIKKDKLLDSVLLIRKAISEGKEMDAEFVCLEEYRLSPLEETLIKKLSAGSYETISIKSLYGVADEGVKVASYKNCYGSPNEVETIIADIYKNKKLDECTIAVTDVATYSQLFFDYALLYDIPVTFGCGIPIINSNPARLLELYYHWMTDGFFGAASINTMIASEAFNRPKLYETLGEQPEAFSWKKFYEVLGGLRLTNDEASNRARIEAFKKALAEDEALIDPADDKTFKDFTRKKVCIPALEIMATELALPSEDFISKYAYVRKGSASNADKLIMQLDMAAGSSIYDELKIIKSAGIEQTDDDIILNVLKQNVCSQPSREGAVHITDISGGIAAVRKELYLAGLSASKFPGSPVENYLLLDDDLEKFGEEASFMTSAGKIIHKREALSTLVHLATSLGSEVHISYAGMNVSELKKDNASSMIFEIFREESGKNVTSQELEVQIIGSEYFKPAISATREVGAAYSHGKEVQPAPLTAGQRREAISAGWNLDKEYSPSALNKFFSCPRSFMLSSILGIPEPDDDKPFEVISAADSGTLAHSLMEQLANSTMTKEEFLKLSEEFFDRYMAENPPLIKESADDERSQFLEMMKTAYEMDLHREVTMKEEEIHCVHETGVKLHGYPDRIEKLDDGRYLVVDFKSGRSISHVQDDITTCLQIVIYAYLLEQEGYDIAGGEFRYIRLGETISCKYDDDMKVQLNEMLMRFKDCMLRGDFEIAVVDEENKNDPCHFCKYASICGKQQ